MKRIAKNIAVYAMVGIMQVGFGVSETDASPFYNGLSPMGQNDKREQDRPERERIEKERHEREMERRPHEGEREWRERQDREKERHDHAQREMTAHLMGNAIGLANHYAH